MVSGTANGDMPVSALLAGGINSVTAVTGRISPGAMYWMPGPLMLSIPVQAITLTSHPKSAIIYHQLDNYKSEERRKPTDN